MRCLVMFTTHACLAMVCGAGLWHAGGTATGAEPQSVSLGAQLRGLIEADWTERDRQFAKPTPPAAPGTPETARPTTTAADAARGCDGVKTGRWGFHTASGETDPWWQVDLGRPYRLDRVVVFNRTDGNTAPRTRHVRVLVATDAAASEFRQVYQHDGKTFYGATENQPLVVHLREPEVTARFVRLQVPGRCSFALDEVEVYAADAPERNIALKRPADQKSVLAAKSPGRSVEVVRSPPPHGASAGPQHPSDRPAFSLAHTREVVRRARELAARLRPQADPPRLAAPVARLDALDARLAALANDREVPEPERKTLYFDARWLARAIAFCNPSLDCDRILFIKRHHPGGLYHMVHQYYGFGAKAGGGLFVLADPFSENPTVTNLLAGARVTNGRLAGQELVPGSFLSPELSYDGRTILFAFTEGGAKGVEWSPRASYHIFRCGVDGGGLTQLTDGPWNEFDPCFLPNGRIVFMSERRGGYLRCGGSAPPYDSPTYTLHAMAGDGSGVVCLSFHETQEWQPSVAHDGRIVYTRWDYVDRDTNVAHHIWTCYPDGSDPRSFHGNYPLHRESRPWMEMDIRAVPGSQRFVATAAAHHGHAFGSLVLIDPHVADDGAMSQLTRLTPDVPFPESEGGKALIRPRMAYGTAWPLSEDDYLCVYDAGAQNHGLYWIDRFGNRELLYRDPQIPCFSPIPVRARQRPPVLPEPMATAGITGRPGAEPAGTAVLTVTNVYDSDFIWPAGAKVTALRIIQVLPKSTAPSNKPRIGVGTQTNARAVLGTVPVEADGSACFAIPAGKPVYFQALDEQGQALQSMRSATYLHSGERLTCQGCHEPKHRSPATVAAVPLALRRPPSDIQPDVDGSNPFNYVRLVQPVWDRNCVACHREKKAVDLSGAAGEQYGWTRSYASLANKYGFYFHVNNGTINAGVHGGSRTVPGQFGARAAPLQKYLDCRHYGVTLTPEDAHRVSLWLDCNSEFYGAYEATEAQARGEIVRPSLE